MVGGGYYDLYGDVLFIIINSNRHRFEEHAQLIKEAVESHPEAKWRFVALHHDLYGSGEHSNEPLITTIRYELAPIFEAYDIGVVFTGYDHTYARSKVLTNSASGSKYYGQVKKQQAYIEKRWQAKVPTLMVVDVGENTITLSAYRTDTMELIDESVTIEKSNSLIVDYQYDLRVNPVVSHPSLIVGMSFVNAIIVSNRMMGVKKR